MDPKHDPDAASGDRFFKFQFATVINQKGNASIADFRHFRGAADEEPKPTLNLVRCLMYNPQRLQDNRVNLGQRVRVNRAVAADVRGRHRLSDVFPGRFADGAGPPFNLRRSIMPRKSGVLTDAMLASAVALAISEGVAPRDGFRQHQ